MNPLADNCPGVLGPIVRMRHHKIKLDLASTEIDYLTGGTTGANPAHDPAGRDCTSGYSRDSQF